MSPDALKTSLEELASALASEITGQVLLHEPMAKHTTLGIGGPADLFVTATSSSDLSSVLAFCRQNHLDITPLGDGSNVLVSDLGVRGVTLKLGGSFHEAHAEGDVFIAGAGARLSASIAEMSNAGLAGLEVVYGVPGSVGGGVYMNAGTKYGCLSDTLLGAWVVRSGGEVTWMEARDLGMSYRHSHLQDWQPAPIVTHAKFQLRQDTPGNIKNRIEDMARVRKNSQPLNWRSCGCMFKNPEGESAGRLIDSAGLKGFRLGGVCVSEKHANFFVTDGSASAADVLKLSRRVRSVVSAKHNVDLQLEVRLLGQWPKEDETDE